MSQFRPEAAPLQAKVSATLNSRFGVYGNKDLFTGTIFENSAGENTALRNIGAGLLLNDLGGARCEYMQELSRKWQWVGDNSLETPDMHVVVPLAIHRPGFTEDLGRSLKQVDRAAEGLGRTVVSLWCNAPINFTGATEEYDKTRSFVAQYVRPGIDYRTALDIQDSDTVWMSRVRHNFMLALTAEAIERGGAYEEPVVWVDDDVTHMSRGALKAIADVLGIKQKPFVHLSLDYSVDFEGKPLAELDIATKAQVLHEVVVRKEKQLRRSSGQREEYEYHQECGLGFMLGTYWKSRGIDTSRKHDESQSLIKGYRDATAGQGSRIDPSSYVEYIEKKMIVSDRRTRELIRQKGVLGLLQRHTSERYLTYTESLVSPRQEHNFYPDYGRGQCRSIFTAGSGICPKQAGGRFLPLPLDFTERALNIF